MPNVLIYMSDQHNPFVSSVFGHPRVETPNMERLAQMGTVFANAYTPSPLCLPCRSAFMAGRPVHQTQMYNNCNAVGFDYPSYGSVLHNQGVHTAYIGKTDVYRHSSELGFTEMIDAADRKPPGDINFPRRPLTIREGSRKRAEGYGPKENPFAADIRKIDHAVRWLTETAPNLDTPWTLTVNTVNPHSPLFVTEELWEKYADAADLPEYGRECESANHPYARDLRDHFETDVFSDEQIRGLRRGYLGCVEYVDRELGRLLDALEESGRLNDTVVVYTSDHGEMLGKFGMWWKSSLYEDSVHVPLIAAGPGFLANTRVETPVSLLDLQATIFRAVDRARPANWWGTPLQEIPAADPTRAVFSEYHGHGVRSGAFMIRKGPWKLMYNMDAPHQLYNLESDPNELHNQAENHPDVLRDLEGELRNLCSPEEENRRAHAFEARQSHAIREG